MESSLPVILCNSSLGEFFSHHPLLENSHMGFGDRTQGARFGGKHLYPITDLDSILVTSFKILQTIKKT